MARTLSDMVVIITGASSGIGRELAVQLSAEGARLALAARRAERLEELNSSLGGKHLVVPTDVAKREQCEALVARTRAQFGRIDTLVCNAGYGVARPVAEMSAEQVQQLFQTNVFGTIDCIRAAVPILRDQEPHEGCRGQVMIVSSAVARRGLPFFGPYAATKAAQLSVAEALRVELKQCQIAVTSVHPITTETEFFDVAGQQGDVALSAATRPGSRQTSATVARKMIAAIRRPRPEVWPQPATRIGLSFSTLLPGLTDKMLAKDCGEMERLPRSTVA